MPFENQWKGDLKQKAKIFDLSQPFSPGPKMNQNDFEPKTAPKWLSSLYDRTYTIRKPK